MLEETLKTIKDSKLDIELLRRKNELLCADNNNDIAKYEYIIEEKEKELEAELKTSGEKKLECKLGYCSYRTMPDKWNYDDAKILDWCKLNHYDYYHITEIVNKDKLKKVILKGELKIEDVPGILTTVQEPKFTYKIKGGL